MFRERGEDLGLKILLPSLKYTTDNAAMIGYAGFFKNAIDPIVLRSEFLDINADPSWEL